MTIPDHPAIKYAETVGGTVPVYYCPNCQQAADTAFVAKTGEIIGCEHCIHTKPLIPRCEYCDAEVFEDTKVYRDSGGIILGCENCVSKEDAGEMEKKDE